MTALGLQPFLIYPAVIKLRTKGNREASIPLRKQRILAAPVSAEVVCCSSAGDDGGAAAAVFSSPAGGADGRMDMVLAAQRGEIARMDHGCLLNLFFAFLFSPLSYWDIVLIYPVQRSLCW